MINKVKQKKLSKNEIKACKMYLFQLAPEKFPIRKKPKKTEKNFFDFGKKKNKRKNKKNKKY